MTYDNNPIELGMDRLVAWDLSDDASISIGALRRTRDEGVSQRINGVEFDGPPFPALNNVKWPAFDDGERIGKVTSAIHSPRLGKNIGYCWLPRRAVVIGHHRVGRDRVGYTDGYRGTDAVRRPG